MLKKLLTSLLILCCFAAVVSAGELVLDLDKPIKAELLLSSKYFQDKDQVHDINSISAVPDSDWTAFNRKQFRFGLTTNPIWVRTRLVTKGHQNRKVVLDLHGIIDHIQLHIKSSDGKFEHYKLGKGSKPIGSVNKQNYFGKKAETDHVKLTLSPDITYDLLLSINSNNAVIGSFRAIEPQRLDKENKTRVNGLIAYLFLVFLVTFYSFIIFITTHDKAFIFHTFYVLFVTGYLFNAYGFIESWLGIRNLSLLENLLAFCLSGTLLSLLGFCKAMIGETYERFPQIIKFLYRLFFLVGIATLCLIFLVPYTDVLRLLVINISLAMILAPFLVFYRPQEVHDEIGVIYTRLLRLRITVLTFTIVGGIHVLTRLGFINVYWFTNYILFIFILIEALLYAGVILININNDKKALFREAFFDRESRLPNERALKEHFLRSSQSKNQTLIYFWVSGFDKLEIALGNSHYREFISMFGEKLSTQLQECNFVISDTKSDHGTLTLFNTANNNFSLICERLNYKNQLALRQLISKTLSDTEQLNHNTIDFKYRIGADGYYPAQDDYETVTQNCLLALAQSIKNNTKITYYDDSLRDNRYLRRQLISDFNSSLRNEELFLVWQPQYDVKSKLISGVEVFTRWEHPEHGLILPKTFIPLLEKSGRICQLSRWVIGKVFRTLPNLHSSYPEIEVSINLSFRDLINNDLIAFLDKQLEKQSHLAPYIVLEISETVLIEHYSMAFKNIKELQLRGFKVSIENFGSGLASFSFLQNIPTDELKIDKTFSDRFAEPKTDAILTNIISLSKRMDIRLVIEGLETKQQVDLFTKLGVGRVQGRAISKPLSLATLLDRTDLIQVG